MKKVFERLAGKCGASDMAGEGKNQSSLPPLITNTVTVVKEFRVTFMALFFFVIMQYLVSPNSSTMPEADELLEIKGMPSFHNIVRGKGGSDTLFFVNDTHIHCGLCSFGGCNACSRYADRIDFTQPVKAAYFRRQGNMHVEANILDALEQNGQMVISRNETYQQRKDISRNRIAYWFITGSFGIVLLLFFSLECYVVITKYRHKQSLR